MKYLFVDMHKILLLCHKSDSIINDPIDGKHTAEQPTHTLYQRTHTFHVIT